MSEEKQKVNLTFGNQPSEEKEEKTAAFDEPVPELKLDVDDSILSPAEKEQVTAFAKEIDIRNTQAIMEYGAGAQKEMAALSEKALTAVKTKDMGAVGDLLTNVVAEVKNFDESTEKKGFLGLFKKTVNKIEVLKTRYDKAEDNITKICNALENHQVTLLTDVAQFDTMYEKNLESYKTLTMYILAGREKLAEVRNGELRELQKKADESGRTEDAQAAKDLADQCARFEKKLYDLNLSRTISQQTAPQIRLIQSSDTQMAEKIQSVLVNTIPLWKNQMVISLGIAHSTEAIAAEAAVTNATNQLLQQNAEQLHIASVEAAKANERGIVDIETLKKTNASLLTTLDDVMKVQAEGRKARADAEIELRKMEDELRGKLLEISTK